MGTRKGYRLRRKWMNTETRKETEAKLEFYKDKLSDQQLRLLVAFASGIFKKG